MFYKFKRAFKRPFRDIFINWLAASSVFSSWTRGIFYKAYGMKVGKRYWIRPGCQFTSNNIKIGNETRINYNCCFYNNDDATIEIGDDCDIAFQVKFICVTHEIGLSERRAGEAKTLPIKIGNGCWIGTGAIILPGVIIGDGCIIAAGAVVARNCESNFLYGGVPARKIKEISN